MAILIRKQGESWERAEEVIYTNEAQLQKMLYDSPELIPTELEKQVAVFTKESGLPGSGFTDLIGVDAQGNVLLVETKLARNREIRREVIGQVLEYAAYLWGMKFEQFDDFFKRSEGKSLVELLTEKDSNIDKEQVRANVESNLNLGVFRLIIGVDSINPELEKIIAYVSRHGGLQLEALELELYRQGGIEILVPKRHGQLNQPQEAEPPKRVLTFEEVLENCPDDHSRKLLALLGSLWDAGGNYVKPGTVGASFQAQIGTKSQPIFWAYPNSGLHGAFAELSRRGAPADALESYRNFVSTLPGFTREEVLTRPEPITRFSGTTETAISTFVEYSRAFVDAWRGSTTA